MATKTIAITVPEELHEKMQKWKDHFNYSRIASIAIDFEIRSAEALSEKINAPKTLEEIMNSFNWREEINNPDPDIHTKFRVLGEDLGIFYGKNGPYQKVQKLRKLLEDWDNRDKGNLLDLQGFRMRGFPNLLAEVFKELGFPSPVASFWVDHMKSFAKLSVTGKLKLQPRTDNLISLRSGFLAGLRFFFEYVDKQG